MKFNEELSAVAKNMSRYMDPEVSDKLKAFDWIRFGGFVQDTEDWTDPDTGEFFKATMDYFSVLTGRRIRDDVNFAVRVRLDHVIVDDHSNKNRSNYVESCLVNGMMQLASYADCDCVVGAPCKRHGPV